VIARRIVRRYAAALFNRAQSAGLVDAVESDLGLVSFAFENSSDLWNAMRAPIVSPEKKKDILRELFGSRVNKITLHYLELLVDKRREEAILSTEAEYIALANEARGVVEADVITAIELSGDEQARLGAKLKQVIGKEVRMHAILEPEILGGVVVKIGDRVIDGSLKSRLAELKEKLSE
jgi:F-type H+-transporting ATPase subunit delta